LESQYKNPSKLKKLFISVRLEAFANIIINKLPWEDFSIGFQCRIKRQPNLYNSKFWYYFTNVYIGAENYRYDANCGACNLINQNKKYI
jgi:CMP-N-acetylneuraminate monooxygenase